MTLSVMQALATGLPAIVTRHSGFSDQVIEGKNGYLVPEGDYRALAERILYYIQHPEGWPRMSIHARAHVQNTYDARVLIGKQIDLYHSLLNAAELSGSIARGSR